MLQITTVDEIHVNKTEGKYENGKHDLFHFFNSEVLINDFKHCEESERR